MDSYKQNRNVTNPLHSRPLRRRPSWFLVNNLWVQWKSNANLPGKSFNAWSLTTQPHKPWLCMYKNAVKHKCATTIRAEFRVNCVDDSRPQWPHQHRRFHLCIANQLRSIKQHAMWKLKYTWTNKHKPNCSPWSQYQWWLFDR